jgi:signal transduction histidine kinase
MNTDRSTTAEATANQLRPEHSRVPRQRIECKTSCDDTRSNSSGALRDTERKQFERQIASIARIERSRVARQLHDGLSQQLAAAAILVESLKQRLANEQSSHVEMANKVVAALEDAKLQSRELSNLVTPIGADCESIVAALDELAQHSRRAGVHCTFESRGPVPPIDSFTAEHLVDFARDAIYFLHNRRQALSLSIQLLTDAGLALVIRGDSSAGGQRLDEHDDPLQILRIRSLLIDGKFSIESSDADWTVITCNLASDVNNFAGNLSAQ